MGLAVEQWKTHLINLSPGERVELAQFLLASVEPEDENIEAEWDAEASKRVEAICSDRAVGRPTDALIAELREQFP
jgi:putative addiction module component (TIGR02574 family)